MLRQIITSLVLFASLTATASADVSINGSLKKWHPLTLDVTGASNVTSEDLNQPHPFLDVRFDVVFESPNGSVFTVPGFFAGDGNGNGTGDVWRTRFSPDSAGVWSYSVVFKTGKGVAVSDAEGTALPIDGTSGTFTIAENTANDAGFLKYGRLIHTGAHYLQFQDGPYWIKGGIDSPENFFGYAGFDNTNDNPGGAGTGVLNGGLHEYPSHVADWQQGDPLFTNSATPEASKGIIGAVNYLASEGVNSLYFLPMNLGGDGRDTHPFVGDSGSFFDNTHYDISKLYQWNMVLNHMQRKGIAAHIVLNETEAENSAWLDDGELGLERKLFYREMVARFSYLLGLKWNISEESRFGAEKHKAFAQYIRSIDWAEHPIAVHTHVNRPEEQYDPIIADPANASEPYIDATSIQFSPINAGRFVEEWREKTRDNPWIIDMDEVGSALIGLSGDNADSLRRSVLYPVYFSGGNIEWYFGYHPLPLGGDLRTEDFRTREAMYRYMRYAREMMQSELPFAEMEPADELHSSDSAQVFAKAAEIYAVYLPDGRESGSLDVAAGSYRQRWFNPRTGNFEGAESVKESVAASPVVTLGEPPNTPGQDWVVLFDIQTPEPATVADNTNEEVVTEVPSSENTNTAENLAPVDVEAPSSETTDVNIPTTDTPVAETPEPVTPEAETPVAETPVAETPEPVTPEAETPIAETPVITDNSNTAQTDTPATNAPEIDVDNTDADRSTTDNAEESPDTAAAQPHFTVGGGSADSGLLWFLLLATLVFRARRKSLLDHHLMS